MTRHFRWHEPGDDGEPVTLTATDEEILANYYPHWCDQMRAAGKGDQISHAHCIEDFMTVHWASEDTLPPQE